MSARGDSPIEHVVVLMLENRSFDHMLGFLPRVGHLANLEGLTGDEYNLVDPSDPNSERIYVHQGALYEWEGVIPGGGPPHDFEAANQQLCGVPSGSSEAHPALNNGFVSAFVDSFRPSAWNTDAKPPDRDQLKAVMGCFSAQQLPTLSTLAQEFMVCDHWFSSVPGPTMPNRLYAHAATSAGYAHNAWSTQWDFKTIYNSLEDAGRSWAVYWANDDVATNFTQLKHDTNNLRRYDQHFLNDVAECKLPNYSFIVPRFIDWNHPKWGYTAANSQHAPADVRPGEALIAEVYRALRGNADVWRKTLLIVCYDEHGGFYDHVVPPIGVPNPDGLDAPGLSQLQDAKKTSTPAPANFDFKRLGFRVPAILVSPWLAPSVNPTHYEHASLAASMKELFGLKGYLTERDAAANSFARLLGGQGGFRDNTPETLPLPTIPPVEDAVLRVQRSLDSIQADIVAGTLQKIPDEKARLAALEKLAAGTLTRQDAATITDEVVQGLAVLDPATDQGSADDGGADTTSDIGRTLPHA